MFVSSTGYRSFHSPGESNMIAQDDPRHADQRALVSRRFTPKAVRANDEWLRATIDSLLDQFGDDEVEVVEAVAAQLPSRLTAKLLGWDESRWPDVKRWSERLMRLDGIADPEVAMDVMTTIIEFNGDLTEMLAAGKGCPVHEAPDLVTVWANAEIDGATLDAESVMHETGLFISGGAETTRTVIARGLRELLRPPGPVGGDGGRPDDGARRGRGAHPLGHAAQQHVPHGGGRHRGRRPGHRRRRPAGAPLPVGQPRRGGVRRPVHLRHDPRTRTRTSGSGSAPTSASGASLARFELVLLFTELSRRFTNLRVVTEIDAEENIFANAVPVVHPRVRPALIDRISRRRAG